MAPRIVVLCDGTWCGRETATQTNIYRLAQLFRVPITNLDSTDTYVRLANPADPADRRVVARYRHGVGLGGGFLDYLFDGATASELAEEVISTYRFIVDHYTPDHEIWMFGLSRGAYTVRSVAGLINNYGILNPKALGLTDDQTNRLCQEAYSLYKSRDPNNAPHAPDSLDFRQRNSWPLTGDVGPLQCPPVRFMGLFDTVGSLGIPTFTGGLGLDYPEFYDDVVSSVVQNVCHLVSVHDRLWAFQPCLARRKDGNKGGIHEEWIPGCHYDLGRQRFRFWRSGAGLLERFINAISYIPLVGPGRTIQPNPVLSDFAFGKMLEQIRQNDTDNILIPESSSDVRLTALGSDDRGSGDVYGNLLEYGPLGGRIGSLVTRILGQLAVWNVLLDLRERVIPSRNATVYRYGQPDKNLPDSQSLDKLADLTKGRERRYPSQTAESWAKRTGTPWP